KIDTTIMVDVHFEKRGAVGTDVAGRVDASDFTPVQDDVVPPAGREANADVIGHDLGSPRLCSRYRHLRAAPPATVPVAPRRPRVGATSAWCSAPAIHVRRPSGSIEPNLTVRSASSCT